jgi:succinoglycan biosynthesis protein ExoM
MTQRPRIIVAVCTYRRNEPLHRLLEALVRNAERVGSEAAVGVVVVDDNPDQRAREVCASFDDAFELGMHYRTVGEGNISIARNTALQTALPRADWVAMTDDDCVPADDWLAVYLEDAVRWDVDAVTGPCYLVPSPGAPRWLVDQPFLDDAQLRFDHGEVMELAATNNSFFKAAFFREREHLRFEPELGVVGGEDMVFFRSAVRAGLRVRFSTRAAVDGHESPSRCTFRYQLRSRFWMGNTEWVTYRFLGEATRPWWALRAVKLGLEAAARPLAQLVRGRPPQVRYAMARGARAVGMLVGALGVRVAHH